MSRAITMKIATTAIETTTIRFLYHGAVIDGAMHMAGMAGAPKRGATSL